METLTIFLVVVIIILALANLFFWIREHFGFKKTRGLNEERDLVNWALSGESDEGLSSIDVSEPGLADRIKEVDSKGWDTSKKGKKDRVKILEKYLKGF